MTWSDTLLGFDTETTGPDPETARIVSFALPEVGADSKVTFSVVDPECEIPAGATAVHGITTEYAKEHGIPAREACLQVAEVIKRAWASGVAVVGHNVSYDFTVLSRELSRHDGAGFTIKGPVIDSLVLDKHFDKYRKGSRKLVDVAAHYGVELGEAHHSLADALASVGIVLAMRERFPELAEMDLRELYVLQINAAREQAASLASYFQRQGKDAFGIDGQWPLRVAS